MKDNIPNYSDLFEPLEKVTGGRNSGEKIVWNNSLRAPFDRVQKATEILTSWPWLNQVKNFGFSLTGLMKTNQVVLLCMLRESLNGTRLETFAKGSELPELPQSFTCEGEAWIIRVAVKNHCPWICQFGVPCEVGTMLVFSASRDSGEIRSPAVSR